LAITAVDNDVNDNQKHVIGLYVGHLDFLLAIFHFCATVR